MTDPNAPRCMKCQALVDHGDGGVCDECRDIDDKMADHHGVDPQIRRCPEHGKSLIHPTWGGPAVVWACGCYVANQPTEKR